MKKKILAAAVFSVFCINGFAAPAPSSTDPDNKLDTVSQVAKSDLPSVAKKCYSLLVASEHKEAATVCQSLASRLGEFKEGSIERLQAQTILSIFMTTTGNSEQAAKDLSSAIELVKEKTPQADYVRAEAYNVLGNIYSARKELKQAGEAIAKAIELADKVGNKTGVVESLSSLASVKAMSGDKTRALEYAKKTVEYGEKLKSGELRNGDQIMFAANRMLAMAYAANGMLDEAITTALKAETMAQSGYGNSPKSNPLVGIKSDIVSFYIAKEDYEKAIPYATDVVKALDDGESQVTRELASAVINALRVLVMASKVTDAEFYADKYALRFEAMPDSAEKVRALGTTGVFYLENTTRKTDAKHYLVAATLVANNIFGGESTTTNELAELAASIETN